MQLVCQMLYFWGVWVTVTVAPNACPSSVVSQQTCGSYCSSHQCTARQSGTRYNAAVVWWNHEGMQWCKCQCCEKPLGICAPDDTGPQVTYTSQCTAAAGPPPSGPPSPPPSPPSSGLPPPCADVGVVDGPSCHSKCGVGQSGFKSVNDAGQCKCNGNMLCGESSGGGSSGGGAIKFILVVLLIAVCGGVVFVAKQRASKQRTGGMSAESLVSGGF